MRLIDNLLNRIVFAKMVKGGREALRILEQNSKKPRTQNFELLFRLLKDNADTEYGKKYGFGDITTIEEFKQRVPFSTYDDYAPYIERMINDNEKNLITVYPIEHYAVSSGSVGVPKRIPVSRETLDHYNRNSTHRYFAHADETYRALHGGKSLRGKGLNTMEVSLNKTENGVSLGAISGASVAEFRSFLPYVFTSPNDIIFPEEQMDMKYLKLRYALEERDTTFMVSAFTTGLVDLMNYLVANWQIFVEDIRTGTINKDVSISPAMRAKLEAGLRPNPARAEELRAAFEQGFDEPIVPRIWPDLCSVGSIGAGGFLGHTERLRTFLGPNVQIDYMVYAASEALMAVAPVVEKPEYVLLPDSCFYEFVPMDSDDEDTTYTMDQLEVGRDYEIIITNLSGFYRYRIKDVIRVLGWYGNLPLVAFVYRKNQMLSIAGEKTNDEAMLWSVQRTSEDVGYRFADYCVYPDTDTDPGHYTVLLEPDRLVDPSEVPHIRDVLDDYVGQANPSYGTKVRTGVLGPLELKLSQIETHALYRDIMIGKGVSSNQLKPVRVLDTPMKERFFFALVEEDPAGMTAADANASKDAPAADGESAAAGEGKTPSNR